MPKIMHQGMNFSGWSETAISNNYGYFIDFDNVVQSSMGFRTTDVEYTATEDCMVIVTLRCYNGISIAKVNDVEVFRVYCSNGEDIGTDAIPVKEGQVVKLHSNTDIGDSSYVVYGILNSSNPIHGTNVEANPETDPTEVLTTVRIDDEVYDVGAGTGKYLATPTPFIYSEDEEQVGFWTDGKPIYQKTFNTGALTQGTVKTFSIADLNMETCVKCSGFGIDPINGWIISINDVTPGNLNGSFRTYVNVVNKNLYIEPGSGSGNGYTQSFITVQYTKTSDVAWQGGFKAYGFSPVIYSEEEREVGVWTDGKPLYQKTFDKSTMLVSDNTWNNDILGTTGSGISIKNYEGYFNLGTTTLFSYNYYRSSSEYFTSVANDDIDIRPNMNAGMSVYAGIVTIWYTKDSDVAGSGKYTTLATPAVHYSTDEHIIGTWIDGKTLYQKSIQFTTASSSEYSSLNLNISNADTVMIVFDASFAIDSNGSYFQVMPYHSSIQSTEISGFVSKTTFDYRVGSELQNKSAVLTVQYTKTT